MTNKEIISNECLLHNITENVDTFASWKNKGYAINKGSKAVFKTKIWKPTQLKETNKETGETKQVKKLILVNASFFSESQVTKISH